MKKQLLLPCLLFSFTFLFAESPQGYIIDLNGDTLKGKIEIKLTTRKELKHDCTPCDPIRFDLLTFEINFAKESEGYKKFEAKDIKGFGFNYGGKEYDFETFDKKESKEIFRASLIGKGKRFALKMDENYFPIYYLFFERTSGRALNGDPQNIVEGSRWIDTLIVIKHPTKGFLYVDNYIPFRKKELGYYFKLLEIEDDFLLILEDKKYIMKDVMRIYNEWKKTH